MIKLNKKLPDYKDFFNVTDYLSTDIPYIFYKKVIINLFEISNLESYANAALK